MKQYIGISRDHSVSMRGIYKAAVNDYNNNIKTIKANADKYDIDTIVSVVENGRGAQGKVVPVITNSSVGKLKPISYSDYIVDGHSTPLFDSVGKLIEQFENLPDKDDKDVSFLIMAITDGEDNNSPIWRYKLSDRIRRLQNTDRWTFVFRVPYGAKNSLIAHTGISAGNIQEWETTEKGLAESSVFTQKSYDNYYSARSRGVTSTDKFFVNTSDLTKKEVKKNLVDISSAVTVLTPKKTELDEQIRDFVEKKMRRPYNKGEAFYLLKRTEKVQEYKKLVILDKMDRKVYGGADARHLLNLPEQGMIKLVPGNINQYDVFVQSTSNNRLVRDKMLVWPDAAI